MKKRTREEYQLRQMNGLERSYLLGAEKMANLRSKFSLWLLTGPYRSSESVRERLAVAGRRAAGSVVQTCDRPKICCLIAGS